jgi:hypothetical protein
VRSSRDSEGVRERIAGDRGARRSMGGKGAKMGAQRGSIVGKIVHIDSGGNVDEIGGGHAGAGEGIGPHQMGIEVEEAGGVDVVEVVAAGSIRARPVLNIESHGATCRIVARALLHIVRVTVFSDQGRKTYQGLVTEVLSRQAPDDASTYLKNSPRTEHTFSLLIKEGLMISVDVSSVEELMVLTLADSPDLAADNHAAACTQRVSGGEGTRHTLLTPMLHATVPQPPFLVPAEAMDDENLILLRSLGESYGRRVLVQNLRHVLVGLSGYRALWSDFLMLTSLVCLKQTPPPPPAVFAQGADVGSGFVGEGVLQGWIDLKRRGWMVKVLPDVETYRESTSLGCVADGKWVPVSEILPMSDYDLETYNTHRHQVLPSSEFDLQRHDSALHLRYSASSSSSSSFASP